MNPTKQALVLTLTLLFIIVCNSQSQTTKTVGSSGDYPTLNAAFADVGNGTLTGDIVFEIISDITETTSTLIYESGFFGWLYSSITVRPSGNSFTINADLTTAIFRIDGNGSNITFDGRIGGAGSENQLTISNASGSIFHIRSVDGVDNIAIQYCNLTGNGDEIISLFTENSTITNILIDNCNIGNESLTVTNGIHSYCTGSGTITATLSNCNIFNFWNASNSSKGIFLDSGNENWTISNNSFYQTTSRTASASNTHYGIYIDGGDGHTITNNYIGGSEPQCGGTAWTTLGDYANKFAGIYLNVGTTTPASLNGNVISNFNHTFHSTTNATDLPGIWTGIYLSGGNADIGTDTGNTIGISTGIDNILVNSTAAADVASFGIGVNSAGSTVNIYNNQIGGITLNASLITNAHSYSAINIASGSNIVVENNIVGSTDTNNSILLSNESNSESENQIAKGITSTSDGNVTISGNTISRITNYGTSKGGAIGIDCSSGSYIVKNNTIENLFSDAYNSSIMGIVMGINVSNTTGNQIITENTITNLKTTTLWVEKWIYGIHFTNNTAEENIVSLNHINDIEFTGNEGRGIGIKIENSTTTVAMNNAIRLGHNQTNNRFIVGILSGGNNKILGNSVYITGSFDVEGLDSRSFAYYKYPGDDVVKNNLFVNNMTSTGYVYEDHVCIGIWDYPNASVVSDYNNLLSSGREEVVAKTPRLFSMTHNTTKLSLEQWQDSENQDANSLSVDPQFVGADDATPDLHITASSPMINMGISVYPLVVDMDDDIRDQQPDIGCDEVYTGSVIVGEGQTYTTLKQAFDAINDGTLTGNISINIQSTTTETATATLHESGYNETSDYTSVSIGTTNDDVIISGNIDEPIVSFNGAHDVNMVNLTIENENSDGYCIQFINSASNNRIAGCTLVGNAQLTSKGLVTFDTAGTGSGNNNNTIENCTFGNGASNYRYGLVSTGTASVGNNDNTITESKIYNFWSNTNSSAGIYIDENNSNWNISDNHFYQTETITATGGNAHYGIQSLSSNNINISSNHIGGTDEECGGTAWTVNGSEPNTFTGIFISGENTGESEVSGNTISSFSWIAAPIANMYTGTGVWTGIGYGGGILTISDNTIGATTGNNNIVVETTSNFHVASYGIAGGIDGANVTVSDNTIGSIDVSSSVNYSHIFVGIQNDGATEITIGSNLVGSETTAQSINASTQCMHTETGQHVAGIVNNANTTTCTIDNNTIKNITNASESGGSSEGASPFGHTIMGIAATDGVNTITSNTVTNLSTSSIDFRTEAVRGISVVSNVQEQSISGNIISSLLTTNNLDNSKLVGIYYDGPTTGTNEVSSNQIFNITSAEYSGLASVIKGVHIQDGVTTTFVNNVISLGSDETAGHEIIGIYTSKNGTFYHNSVSISGDVSGSLDANTYAFRINLDISTAVVKNNIFVNTRTNSGTGRNYAALCQGTIELDYNAYWVDGTGTVLGNDGTDNKTELPIVAGQDANSVNDEITFTSPTLGDLSTTTAAVNAAADQSVGITTDYEGNTRNLLYPDMGAYEFTQPIIIDPGANLDFGWTDVLTPTVAQSYQIVGIDLSNNMVVTAPEHFQVSLSSDEGFAQSVSVPPSNSNVDATIYARLLPNEEGFHFGNISNSASGQEVTVNAQGSAHAIAPILGTGLATDLTTETATANAEVTHTGGQTVTRRGIIHWPYDGVDKEIGDAGVLNEQETGSFGAEGYSLAIAGLDINTQYNYRAHAYNGETGYGETTEFWTLASTPSIPITTNITGSTVDIEIEVDQNPAFTQYAIYETTTNRFVQVDGTMETTPVWQTMAEWGIMPVVLYNSQNRTGNRDYTFEVKARNGANVETDYSESVTFITLANTPNIMWVGNIAQTSVDISVYTSSGDYSNNSATTQYAVTEHNSGLFVQADGTLGTETVWKTRDEWVHYTVTGLDIGTEYSFSSIARNDDGIETDPGSEISTYTLAAVPGAPFVTILDEADFEIEITPAENPSGVEYCLNVVANSNSKYVDIDGAQSNGPVWQTKAEWDNTLVTAVAPNTAFYLTAKARNGAGVVTDASAQFNGITTAEIPPAPHLTTSWESATEAFSLWLQPSSNPASTELSIQNEITGKYVQPDGTFADTPAWQTKGSWDETEVKAEAATRYNIRVKARNTDEIETAFGESYEIWTNPYTPGLTLTNVTSNTIDAVIDARENPANVEYALKTINSNKWVQADGTLGDDSFWQTLESWGDNITITELSPDTEYGVIAYARAKEEQSVYIQANARTLANIPGAPTFSDITQNSLKITIDINSNPTTVRYAIYETTTELYVGANGTWTTTPTWFNNNQYSTSISVNGLQPITQYTFRVKARNSDDVETVFGPEANVTTLDGPPTAPTLLSPANRSEDQLNTILLEWEGIINADSYGIQVSRDSYFNEIIVEEEITSTSIEVSDLPDNKTIYWRVNATNEHGTGSWSEVWWFKTEPGPPEPPTLLFPSNGDANLQPAESFGFRWTVPDYTEGFTIQISLQQDFSSFELNHTYSLTSWNDPHYFYFDNISHNTTYFWRVKAWNEHGEGQWSEEYSFSIIDKTPALPTMTSPANGLTDKETHNANFEWEPANNAEWYELQVATNSELDSLIVYEKNNTSLYYTLYDLNENTTYHWRVRSVNPWEKSNWTSTWSFTTGSGTSIKAISQIEVTVNPNPASHIIHITGLKGKYRVEVISESGIKLIDKEVTNNFLNISNLIPGVYILRIETDQGIAVMRFIKL